MSGYEALLLGLLAAGAMTGYILLLIQSTRQQRQIQALQRQLDMFADSSINVARSVDSLVRNGPVMSQITVASRRWLVQQAQQRMAGGESLQDIAGPLGLSSDEVRLLNVANG